MKGFIWRNVVVIIILVMFGVKDSIFFFNYIIIFLNIKKDMMYLINKNILKLYIIF